MHYGDRAPGLHCTFPEEAFYHNGKGGCVLDVTQAPFFAKGDGVSDDTEALRAALTFVREHREIVRRGDEALCHPKGNRNWIVYLPNGVYSVHDTISQNWPARAMNVRQGWNHLDYFQVSSPDEEWELYRRSEPETIPCLHSEPKLKAIDNNDGCFIKGQYNSAFLYDEINWNIRIFGESREGVVIRLKDRSPGFGPGMEKSVLSFFQLQRGSNVNLGNFLENMTIDTGMGNPGAVALCWNSSNWGGVRNVALRSGDGTGVAAMQLHCNNATGYCRDLFLEGFDAGIDLAAGRESMVALEYATIANMRRVGIHIGDAKSGGGADAFNGRGLLLKNMPMGVEMGSAGEGILLDSRLENVEKPWKYGLSSFFLWRDIADNGRNISDGASFPPLATAPGKRAPLHIEDAPLPSLDHSKETWVSVEDFGAAGDGRTDDTEAVQRAVDSGAHGICFTRSNYVINGCVRIPASVREMTGLFAGIQRSAVKGRKSDSRGIFCVAGKADKPLIIRQMVTGGGVFLDHEAQRTVALEDIMVLFNHVREDAAEDDMLLPSAIPQDVPMWRLYRNTTPDGMKKRLFVTDCIGFAGDDGTRAFKVDNAEVWARLLDTEHVACAFSFSRSNAWIFGFKSENCKTLIHADKASNVVCLGGNMLNFKHYDDPMLQTEDTSSLAICFCHWHWQTAPTIFRSDETHAIHASELHELNGLDAGLVFCS